MTVRQTILTLAVAGLACAAPAAQAHLLVNDSAVTSKASGSALSSFNVKYYPGSIRVRVAAPTSSSVRPDDRAGVRGI